MWDCAMYRHSGIQLRSRKSVSVNRDSQARAVGVTGRTSPLMREGRLPIDELGDSCRHLWWLGWTIVMSANQFAHDANQNLDEVVLYAQP